LSSEPRSSARPSSWTLVAQLTELDLRLLDRQLRLAQRVARKQALFEQLLIAFELGLRRLQLQLFHFELAEDLDERLLEGQP
jgi:hypothetical protein